MKTRITKTNQGYAISLIGDDEASKLLIHDIQRVLTSVQAQTRWAHSKDGIMVSIEPKAGLI